MDAVLKRLHERAAASAGVRTDWIVSVCAAAGRCSSLSENSQQQEQNRRTTGNKNTFSGMTAEEELRGSSDETKCGGELERKGKLETVTESQKSQGDESSGSGSTSKSGGTWNTEELRTFQEQSQTDGFKCLLCSKRFKWPYLLQGHLNKSHPESPKKCKACGKKFSWSCQLPSHVCLGENKDSRYVCHVCGKTFQRSGALIQHQDKHLECKTFTCAPCKRAYSVRAHLIAHLREMHGDSAEYAVFKKELQKRNGRYTRDRSQNRRYSCFKCSKVFKHALSLSSHMNMHAGDRPYPCMECGKGFTSKSSLRCHRNNVHSNHRPHTCHVCSQAFKKTETLKKHLRTHTGEKPFSCERCGKKFSQNISLSKHMVIHTKERPAKCSVCGVTYPWRQSLWKHMASCHPPTSKQAATHRLPPTDFHPQTATHRLPPTDCHPQTSTHRLPPTDCHPQTSK